MRHINAGKEAVRRWLTSSSKVSQAVELVVLAVGLPLLGVVVSSTNPLGINGGFPWVILGPLLFAARYGVAAGLSAAALASVAYLGIAGTAAVGVSVGTVLGALLVGELTTGWRQRALRAEAQSAYLKHRLKEFSNEYHVLSLSHGQLEAHIAGQRMSLRRALQRLKPALVTREASREASEDIMAVFAQFCSIQVAGLYVLSSETVIDPQPLATIGGMGELPRFDPLLKLALNKKQLVSIKLDAQGSEAHAESLLAVAPIVDSRDQVHAVLVVQDMHFMAFQQDNLNKLALLAASIGDRIARNGSLHEGPQEHFMAELDTAIRFVRSHAVDASLMVARLPLNEPGDLVAEELSSNFRSLDSAWRVPGTESEQETQLIAVLMPLTSRENAHAWLHRLADKLKKAHGIHLQDTLLSMRCMSLSPSTGRRQCLDFIVDTHAAGDTPTSKPRVA